VAEDAYVDFEIRHLEGDDVDTILADIGAEVASRIAPLIAGFLGTGVTIDVRNRYPGLAMAETSPALALVQSLLPDAITSKVSFGTRSVSSPKS
jgi:acetylornithine deacetylase